MCEHTSIFPLYVHVLLKKNKTETRKLEVISQGKPASDDDEQVCDSSSIFGIHSIF